MSGKRAVLVGLGVTALVAGLAPIVTVKVKYAGLDWGAIQDKLTSSSFFTGDRKKSDGGRE